MRQICSIPWETNDLIIHMPLNVAHEARWTFVELLNHINRKYLQYKCSTLTLTGTFSALVEAHNVVLRQISE